MTFHGESFFFDGIPSEHFGLLIYRLGGESLASGSLGSSVEILEDRILGRYDSLHYGTRQKEPLTFSIAFGSEQFLDRYDLNVISSWLTGHSEYKWLEIVQPDMEYVRYKCILSNLTVQSIGNLPVAFTCDVHCDSPFAYTYPIEHCYSVSTALDLCFLNHSAHHGYFYPMLELRPTGESESVCIINKSDGNRRFLLSGLSAKDNRIITFDNQNQIIRCSSGENLYPFFNLQFLRFVQGENHLEITGSCDLKITCEFPMSVGS